jgi:hypothetical protein
MVTAIRAFHMLVPDGTHFDDLAVDEFRAHGMVENTHFRHSVVFVHREEFLCNIHCLIGLDDDQPPVRWIHGRHIQPNADQEPFESVGHASMARRKSCDLQNEMPGFMWISFSQKMDR